MDEKTIRVNENPARAQLSALRMVEKQGGEIVMNDMAKTGRDGFQQLPQVEDGDNRVIDYEQ